MKITKTKIVVAIIIAAVLVLAFVYGGNFGETEQQNVEVGDIHDILLPNVPEIEPVETEKLSILAESKQDEVVTSMTELVEKKSVQVDHDQTESVSEAKPTPIAPQETKPAPIEPQEAEVASDVHDCSLSVRCDTILNNMDLLDEGKVELVPSDGVIFAAQTVEVEDGESVFDILKREMKNAGIHMEFVDTPAYNSTYIEGINNLYEFDCGELSGWMYKVNGVFPNYGCSRYQVNQGDKIELVYTCNLGRDVGGGNAAGGY